MTKPIILAESILDALPSELSRGLFARGRLLSLDADQILFLAGDEGDGCYRVEEGLLKASVAAPNGGERILAILGPRSVVGELSMIDGAPRSASVTALRDSKLCFISQADFDAIAKSRPVPPYLRVVEARPLSPEERLKQLTRNFRRRERCI